MARKLEVPQAGHQAVSGNPVFAGPHRFLGSFLVAPLVEHAPQLAKRKPLAGVNGNGPGKDARRNAPPPCREPVPDFIVEIVGETRRKQAEQDNEQENTL